MAALWRSCAHTLLLQRGHLFGWVPVCLSIGIGLYFTLPTEPPWPVYLGLVASVAVFFALARRAGDAAAPLAVGAGLIVLGMILTGARAHLVAEPVLGWRYYGPIEGRVVGIDRSPSDALRVTLERVRLANVSPDRTPARVRLSVLSANPGVELVPGLWLGATGNLSPPSGPTEPGGFDFQRYAWFLGLGAVGYTRVPMVALAPPDDGQLMFRIRMAMSARVQAALPGESGGFAAAIMTGDRSGMGQETVTALRISNLAHIISISGLHMGLLVGFVFGALRYGLALIPWLALRTPAKPIAAALSLVIAAFYLGLAGNDVATERAFIMVAVMLVAVMLNRRAISLRSVAMAALIVLTVRPEALMWPGFQMSFAATAALIAVFGWLQHESVPRGPRWLRPALLAVISSAVAGMATAPYAAAHFNQFAHYGLIANLASATAMGVVVMPAAVVSVCLMPLGLEWIGLWFVGLGLDWVIWVAHWISGLSGARGTVVSPGPWVLPLLTIGGVIVILWQGPTRLAGFLPILLAGLLWIGAERPPILISDTGGLVGIMTPEGRALSASRGDGFVAQTWLENDGDPATQKEAAARWPGAASGLNATGAEPIRIIALRGKSAAAALNSCGAGDWVVTNTNPEHIHGMDGCVILGPQELRQTGAQALYPSRKQLRVVTARDRAGNRPWNTHRAPPRTLAFQ